MKIILAGGRDFSDYKVFYKCCCAFLNNQIKKDIEIVSGGASGADKMGEMLARARNIPLKLFNANWKEYGKAAGPIRNREMANYATHLIAFWDGESAGTRNMIIEAQVHRLQILVYDYKGNLTYEFNPHY